MMRRRGFTALEIVIVVIIIAILAVTGYPRIGNMLQGYREMAVKASLGSLRSQISVYHDRNASWPAVADLEAPVNAVTSHSEIDDTITEKPTGTSGACGWFYITSNGHIWAANNLDW